MKIAIRAEGGSKIGMGHIMRTLTLAKELKKNNDVFYICKIDRDITYRDDFQALVNGTQESENISQILNKFLSDKYKTGIEKIIKEGFKVFLVRDSYLFNDLKNINADLLITDSYDVDEEYFNKTKAIFAKTAYIDDMNLYYFNVDLLLNQNINAEDFNYKVNKNTRLILGPKYLMLREEFRSAPKKIVSKDVKDIMITLGGADPYNLTEKILTWISGFNFNFHIVIGPSFKNIKKLERFQNKNIKLYFNANMYELIIKCDIAISACGSTLYELAVCGTPTIGIITADNQKGIASKFQGLGIIINLGFHKDLKEEAFLKMLEKLILNYERRRNMSEDAASVLDAGGVERLSKIINSIKEK